jgi:hypothetical protein
VNGGMSGMAATCIIQPIDMVKVRIQLGATGSPVSTRAPAPRALRPLRFAGKDALRRRCRPAARRRCLPAALPGGRNGNIAASLRLRSWPPSTAAPRWAPAVATISALRAPVAA